jgi:hypothetical protein
LDFRFFVELGIAPTHPAEAKEEKQKKLSKLHTTIPAYKPQNILNVALKLHIKAMSKTR